MVDDVREWRGMCVIFLNVNLDETDLRESDTSTSEPDGVNEH